MYSIIHQLLVQTHLIFIKELLKLAAFKQLIGKIM